MRVKNIIVGKIEVFQELLIRELIDNEISFVQIENEFHFLDGIYCFYDYNEILPNITFENIITDIPSNIAFENIMTNIPSILNMESKCNLEANHYFIELDSQKDLIISDKKNKYQNRKILRNNNRMINQKIKMINK